MKKYTVKQKEANPDLTAKRSKRKKVVLALSIAFILLPALIISLSIGGFGIWASTKEIDKSLLPTFKDTPVFYDMNGSEIDSGEIALSKDEIPSTLKNAFIAIEDKRFLSHKGYDIVRIAGATVKNIKSGKVKEGASTITQQLVKNTHLSGERTIKRKLNEIAIAAKIEKEYDKDEIISMYLSVIYFGSGAYGVKQAARVYFDKSPNELTLAECATLAGIVKSPKAYSPVQNPSASNDRKNLVLSLMQKQGYISQAECEKATNEVIKVNSGKQNSFDFFLSCAKDEICKTLGITKYQLGNLGLKIYTSLDPDLQRRLEEENISSSNFESENVSGVSIVIDNESGQILAYCSPYPYTIYRQGGSVLKPLAVYAPAIDKGLISLATPITDEKTDFSGYSPDNFAGIYYGNTTVREAIKKSMNSVSVKVLDYLGTSESANYLNNMGISISDGDKNYSLALGATSKGVSPLSVAGGYFTLANGGKFKKPSFIRFVLKDGIKMSEFSNDEVAIFKPSTASLMSSALIDTAKDGTARTLGVLPFEVSAKTGTVQKGENANSDAWCASYNDKYTVVVWHGSDKNMTERGGGYPTRHSLAIWKALSQSGDMPLRISMSDSVIPVEIDTYSTKAKKAVISATENTPAKYKMIEYFPLDKLPTSFGSLFDELPEPALSISCQGGKVHISLDCTDIYTYTIYRTDALGKAAIFTAHEQNENISFDDTPISLGEKVEYEIELSLGKLKSSKTYSVFTDGFFV